MSNHEKDNVIKPKVPPSRGVIRPKGKGKKELEGQYTPEEEAFFKLSDEEQKKLVKEALKKRGADDSDKSIEDELNRIKTKRADVKKAVRDLGKDYNDNFFLIAELENLAKYNKSNSYSKYFTSIRSKGPVTPLNLFAKFSGQEAFHQLSPAQLSLLTPYVKFSIVRYSKSGGTTLLQSETAMPLQGGYIDPNSSILDPFARGQVGRGNIGMKSFSWNFSGKNPAEAGTLNAKLELFSDSLLVLDKEPYRTMLQRTQTGIEVKAVVGWSASSESKKLLGDKLYNAIKQARQTILMTKYQFEFDFQQDGSYNLTLDFIGRFDVFAKKFDLLRLPRSLVNRQVTAHKVKDKLKKKQAEQKTGKKPPEGGSVFGEIEETPETDRPYEENPQSELFEQAQEEQSELEATEILLDATEGLKDADLIVGNEETRKGLKTALKTDNAASAFQSLVVDQIDAEASRRKQENMSQFQKRLYGNFGSSNKIHVLKVDKSAYDNYKESIRKRKAAKKSNKNAKGDVVEDPKSKDTEGTIIKGDQEDLVNKGEKKGKKGPKKKPKNVVEPDVSASPTGVSVGKAEVMNSVRYDSQDAANSHFISFFFLGDLFDVIHEMVKDQGNLSEMPHIFLGSFRFFNHFTKSRHMIEMADIPISVGRYNAWFHRHYVAKKVNRINLGSFIRNIFKDLVRPVFTGEVFYDAPIKGNPAVCQIKVSEMSAAKYGSGIFGRQNASNLISKGGSGLFHYPGKGPSKTYMIVTSDVSEIVHSGGDRKKDAANGIMHYYMGRDAGIIETVTFQIEPIQGLRESAITRSNGGKAVDIARMPYRANLKTVGNNLFTLGSKFYLLPTLPGGNARYVAGRLGLGGYYVVTSISNVISPGRFETIVNGVQESMAAYNKNDVISNEEDANNVKKVGGRVK